MPALIAEWRALERRHHGTEAARFRRLADQLDQIDTDWGQRRNRIVDLRNIKKRGRNGE